MSVYSMSDLALEDPIIRFYADDTYSERYGAPEEEDSMFDLPWAVYDPD